jgi:uncharacterized protein YkwD
MRFLAALVVVVAAVHAPATSAQARFQTQMERRAALETAVVKQLNDVRAQRGLRPLRASPGLRSAARTHSRAMLDAGFFGHESPGGQPFGDRIRHFYGDRGWKTWSVGEALLTSQGASIEASAIVQAWIDSPSHREIILGSSWRDVGIGAFYAPVAPRAFGNEEAVVVTADFGLRSGRVSG